MANGIQKHNLKSRKHSQGIDERYATLRQERLAAFTAFSHGYLQQARMCMPPQAWHRQVSKMKNNIMTQLKGHESQLGSNIQTLLEASKQILSQSKPPSRDIRLPEVAIESSGR